jgi:hypothetical protein
MDPVAKIALQPGLRRPKSTSNSNQALPIAEKSRPQKIHDWPCFESGCAAGELTVSDLSLLSRSLFEVNCPLLPISPRGAIDCATVPLNFEGHERRFPFEPVPPANDFVCGHRRF